MINTFILIKFLVFFKLYSFNLFFCTLSSKSISVGVPYAVNDLSKLRLFLINSFTGIPTLQY